MAEKRTVYIVGHKNPDTDSICSAISYAYLKTKTQEKRRKRIRSLKMRRISWVSIISLCHAGQERFPLRHSTYSTDFIFSSQDTWRISEPV